MISRVADSIYWMNRYLERAENIARFIDVNLHLILDLGFEAVEHQWQTLVTTSGDDKDFSKRYNDFTENNVINFLTFDEENPNSILSCVRAARQNAKSIRDTISSEMWEQVNRFYLLTQKYSRMKEIINLQAFFHEIKQANHLFIGLSDTTMSHGQAWHFARMGRILERADKTARILDVKYFLLLPSAEFVNSSYDAVQWAALLKSTSAFEMYRKKFHAINYKDVADFLIYDTEFPRSLSYCLLTTLKSMRAIVGYTKTECAALTELDSFYKELKNCEIETILRDGLHEFIDRFQQNLNHIDQEIRTSFIEMKLPTTSAGNKQVGSQLLSQ